MYANDLLLKKKCAKTMEIRVHWRPFAVTIRGLHFGGRQHRLGCIAPPMNTNDLLLKDEVFQIVGAALEVLNGLGHGLHEKPYENALVIEFGLRTIPSVQQVRFDVIYKTVKVSEYVPDLIAYEKVVVDAKVIERITDHERGQ